MRARVRRLAAALPVAALMAVGQGAFVPSVGPMAAHGLAWAAMNHVQHRIVSGRAATLLTGEGLPADEVDTYGAPNTYFPTSDDGCPASIGGNIKVN